MHPKKKVLYDTVHKGPSFIGLKKDKNTFNKEKNSL